MSVFVRVVKSTSNIPTQIDLWSGGGASVVVWLWEAIGRALSLTKKGHMSYLVSDRSHINLKNQDTMDGVSYSILATNVKFMICII